MIKTIQVANMAIINEEDEILLLKRSANLRNAGCWSLPGGLVDLNENPETTVLREVNEETGIKNIDLNLLGFKTFLIENPGENVNITVFKANLKGSRKIVLSDYEHTEHQWVAINELSNINPIIYKLPEMLNELLTGE